MSRRPISRPGDGGLRRRAMDGYEAEAAGKDAEGSTERDGK